MTEQLADLLATFTKQSNKELSAYFFDNAEKIDSLIQLYAHFNQQTTQLQVKRIRELKRIVQALTGDYDWQDHEELDLQYSQYNDELPLILLEGGFESTRGNALGKFVIKITTRTIQAWNYYEDQLMQDFPAIEPIIAGDKTSLIVNTVLENDETKILGALMTIHTYLVMLTNKTARDKRAVYIK